MNTNKFINQNCIVNWLISYDKIIDKIKIVYSKFVVIIIIINTK